MNRSLLCVAAAMCLINPVHGSEPAKGPLVFETHVRPILKAHCFECHGEGKKIKGGLDLRLSHLLARGGKSGPALVAGKPGESPILERVRSQEMPPGKRKLTQQELAVLEALDQGRSQDRPA